MLACYSSGSVKNMPLEERWWETAVRIEAQACGDATEVSSAAVVSTLSWLCGLHNLQYDYISMISVQLKLNSR